MFTYTEKKSLILSIAAAVLAVALLVLQFLPFWYYNEDTKKVYDDLSVAKTELAAAEAAVEDKEDAEVKAISIQGYVWGCNNHKQLTKIFQKENKEFTMNDFVGLPVLIIVAAGLAVIFAIMKNDNPLFGGICSVLAGGAALMFLLTEPLLGLGLMSTIPQMIVAALLALLGIYMIIVFIFYAIAELKRGRV